MVRKLVLAGLLVVGVAGLSFAGNTTTAPSISNFTHQSGAPTNNTVALLETTTTALGGVLTSLGVTFDDYQGPPFPTALSQYTDVFLGMDGGLMEPSDVQNLANYANAGGHLHFFGGTCWQDYVNGMNTYICQNNVNNYCWTTVGSTPDVRVTDPNNCLAHGLAATYNFTNIDASYYQFRATDPAIAVAADNGDGYHMLFSKVLGSGTFDICINSSFVSYWAGNDLAWMTQVVTNMLHCGAPVPTKTTSWGSIKNNYK